MSSLLALFFSENFLSLCSFDKSTRSVFSSLPREGASYTFFYTGIERQWELHQIRPKAIFYLISKIPKDMAKQLSTETNIPYRGILPLEREFRRLKTYVNVGAICILSDYPLPRAWQDTIERCAPQPAILMSLFLSETLC
ncbi:Uncharacterised protein [Chlamydia abortus]|nr:uncharacterized protein CHAB577_0389 [Chlamydia abortus]SFV97749.1 Uncharacterised protein [Chlamydia abortus]SFV98610.1 Uncharacterised protein [Chlamydia abortus]SFV98712.1 Uncharacterised protein [Chlamydia abortus]SFW00417.1 Uncharacterised protein [Chlamydia abortus]